MSEVMTLEMLQRAMAKFDAAKVPLSLPAYYPGIGWVGEGSEKLNADGQRRSFADMANKQIVKEIAERKIAEWLP